jgi:hypothetical protein
MSLLSEVVPNFSLIANLSVTICFAILESG